MAKCANCVNDAVHFIRNNLHNDVDYCDSCLPKAYKKRVRVGEKFPEPKKAPAPKAEHAEG